MLHRLAHTMAMEIHLQWQRRGQHAFGAVVVAPDFVKPNFAPSNPLPRPTDEAWASEHVHKRCQA